MSNHFITMPPQYANILAFQRTDDYPKPGSIVSINSAAIEKYAKELEAKRDPDDKYNGKIYATLPPHQQSSMFYHTHIELKYDIPADMMMIVDKVIPSKKGCRIKCFLQMLNCPSDIDYENRFMYFSDKDVHVVKPVICENVWTFSKFEPDNIFTFGLQVKINNSYWWHTYKKIDDMSPEFTHHAIQLGFKEFSYISTIKPESKEIVDTKTIKDVTETTTTMIDVSNNDFDNVEVEFDMHPMSEFVEKLYEITCASMYQYGINTTAEFREYLRQKYINLTINASVKVDFYDEDDE